MNNSEPLSIHAEQGAIKISVSAKTDVALFEQALRAVFQLVEGSNWLPAGHADAPSGELIGFRATGATEAILLGQTICEAIDEADSQNVVVVGVDVAGVMAVDEGLRAWGYLLTKPSVGMRREATLVGTATIERGNGVRTAEFELRVVRPKTGQE